MAILGAKSRRIELRALLFDRFEGKRSVGLEDLARDLADILGARRYQTGPVPGMLSWGLPGIGNFSPSSEQDHQRLADLIAGLIARFEPRLERVTVTPVGGGVDFRFTVAADLSQESDRALRLRILAPRRGGALGADVVYIDSLD